MCSELLARLYAFICVLHEGTDARGDSTRRAARARPPSQPHNDRRDVVPSPPTELLRPCLHRGITYGRGRILPALECDPSCAHYLVVRDGVRHAVGTQHEQHVVLLELAPNDVGRGNDAKVLPPSVAKRTRRGHRGAAARPNALDVGLARPRGHAAAGGDHTIRLRSCGLVVHGHLHAHQLVHAGALLLNAEHSPRITGAGEDCIALGNYCHDGSGARHVHHRRLVRPWPGSAKHVVDGDERAREGALVQRPGLFALDHERVDGLHGVQAVRVVLLLLVCDEALLNLLAQESLH
mmetsp:Transcript_14219/g.59490  ORF Transcript_14219/g.59490 Transcript_14219/m.59490 type:complete len:294 (-) Transcript_14219:1231-2112(-)